MQRILSWALEALALARMKYIPPNSVKQYAVGGRQQGDLIISRIHEGCNISIVVHFAGDWVESILTNWSLKSTHPFGAHPSRFPVFCSTPNSALLLNRSWMTFPDALEQTYDRQNELPVVLGGPEPRVIGVDLLQNLSGKRLDIKGRFVLISKAGLLLKRNYSCFIGITSSSLPAMVSSSWVFRDFDDTGLNRRGGC